MIAMIVALLLRVGVRPAVAARIAKPVMIIMLVLAIAAIVWAASALVYRSGSRAGSAKVEVEIAQQRAERITEARADERAAADVTSDIADRTTRADALSASLVQTTIEDIRDALASVPPAAVGAPPPVVPVDRLRDDLNASIARANRAAGPAAAP